MKKPAACMLGAIAFLSTMAGTAFADYTDSPSPSAGVAGAGDTAFTGGSVSTALLVALALVAIGVFALMLARRRAAASS